MMFLFASSACAQGAPVASPVAAETPTAQIGSV